MSTLDIFIEKGVKEGRMEKSVEFVKNLLLKGDFSTAEIASLVSVTEVFVFKVKESEGLQNSYDNI